MAIKLVQKRNLSAIRFISQNDDSIDLENSNYDEYLKTGIEDNLKFIDGKQPTVFVCNFELKGKESAFVKDSMIKGTDSEGKPSVAIGSWSFKLVKTVLKDIINPDYLTPEEKIVFKSDKGGYATDDLISLLDRYNIVSEIFGMYNAMTTIEGRDLKN
jgi:hypothetical protein